MKTLLFCTAATALIGTLGFGIQGAWSDDDPIFGNDKWQSIKIRSTGVAPVRNKIYTEECGSCHFAYPGGLLPTASWQKVMAGLENHFGDNAELDAQTQNAITEYLAENSADTSDYRRSKAIMYSLKASNMPPPLRITKTPYFKREHSEIPARIVQSTEFRGSLSECTNCHQQAGKGSFNEHEINIKGFGPWED